MKINLVFAIQIFFSLILFALMACVEAQSLSRERHDQWVLATYPGQIVVAGTNARNDFETLFAIQREALNCVYYRISFRLTATEDTPVFHQYARFEARLVIDGAPTVVNCVASVYEQRYGKVHHFEFQVQELSAEAQRALPHRLATGNRLRVQIVLDNGLIPDYEFSLAGASAALRRQENLCFDMMTND